ncbi:MAG: alpha/beta hydrolase [Prevotella sp.]|nr:alpha/beta hydrolase [Prevotella sp.]
MKRIFLHGLGQTPDSWEKTAELLNSPENNICPDLAALLDGREASYANLYAAFSEFCGGFDGAADLCGLSLGGVLALNYAVDYPQRVNSLALIAPQYRMPKGLLRFQNILFRFTPRKAFPETGFGKADFIRLCGTMTELDFSGCVHNITCPALVICGERDTANIKAARELADILENAELQIISGSGHEANTDAPEKLAEILNGFYGNI